MNITAIPVVDIIIDPYYNGIIIFNFLISIVGLIVLNLRDIINNFLKNEDIKLDSIAIMEVLFRMLILFNVGFFLYQFLNSYFILIP